MIFGAPPFHATTTRLPTRKRFSPSIRSSASTLNWFANEIDSIRLSYEDFSHVVNDPNPEEDSYEKIQLILVNWAAAFEGEALLRAQLSKRIDCCPNSFSPQKEGFFFENEKKDELIARCKVIRRIRNP